VYELLENLECFTLGMELQGEEGRVACGSPRALRSDQTLCLTMLKNLVKSKKH